MAVETTVNIEHWEHVDYDLMEEILTRTEQFISIEGSKHIFVPLKETVQHTLDKLKERYASGALNQKYNDPQNAFTALSVDDEDDEEAESMEIQSPPRHQDNTSPIKMEVETVDEEESEDGEEEEMYADEQQPPPTDPKTPP
jgi:hypothetical protein